MKYVLALLALFAPTTALAQVAISQLPSASTPLAGTEIVPIVQSGTTKQVAVSSIQQSGSTSGNKVLASPNGSSGAPSFRSLVTADIPTGTSGAAIPLLNTANTWALTQSFPASTTSSPSVVLTPGTTPTAPANGSLWTTSGGLYSEVAGTAVGPYAATSATNSWTAQQVVTNAYPNLSTSTDYVRSVVGGFPASDQYSNVGYQVNGIVGAVTTPSGTVTGAHIFDSGVSGYAQTNNVNRDAIGLYGEAGILTAGASAYGLNTEAINCENHSVTNCGAGHGLNMGQNWSIEADISLYKVGSSAPTGSASGVSAVVYAETQPTGTFTGFQCVQNTGLTGSQPWKTCLQVFDGTASQAAIQIGATAVYSSSALGSMSQYFNTYNSGGTLISVPLYADSSQTFHVGANTLQVDGPTNPALATHNSTTGATWYLISNASSLLQFYNGSASPLTIASSIVSANVPLQLAPTTFSALPTCNSGIAGAMAYITDASSAISAWHQQVTAGGGSNKAFIACNGSGWYAFDY